MISSKEKYAIHPIIVPTKHGLGSFNFYLVEESNSLTLIDAGIDSDGCWEYFTKTLHEKGFDITDLTRIIVTHHHEDHIGIINRITSKKAVPVYAHEKSIPRMKRDKELQALRMEFFQQLYQEMGCGDSGVRRIQELKRKMCEGENYTIQADILPLAESDTIAGLRVIETPGHSLDHVVFLQEQRKWLFSGDHLVSHISSNAIVEPDEQGKRVLTLVEYMHSLEKCLTLDVETAFSGHGNLIHNSRELIQKRINGIHRKSARFVSLIKDGLSTADQLAQVYYKDKYQSEFYLVMSEIIGHVDYLELTNKVRKELKGGIWHYTYQ